jgi:acyl carrier protein
MIAMSQRVIEKLTVVLREKLFIEAEPDDDLVALGLDSAGFMRLFHVLEEELGVPVQHVDLSLDNFATLSRIARFVEARALPATAPREDA